MENITLDSYISDNKKEDKSKNNNNRDNKGGRFNRNNRNNDNNRGGNNNNHNNNKNNNNNRNGNRRGGDSRGQRNNNNFRNRRDNQRRQRRESFGGKEEKRESGKFMVIENLHYSVTEEELLEHATKYGEVIECKIFWDENGRSTEKAIIQFENEDDAKKAIESMEGASIEDQTLTVHFASNDDVSYIKKTKKIQKSNK